MHADPSSLDTSTLAACLRSSAGEERDRQVDFLRYLDPFDARQGYREAGYDSLWRFCLRELRLREGAAGRRIGAMRALRELPALEAPLRDGRLSLTTVVTLRPVLTAGNLDEVVARAAFKTDEETRHLVASLLPRPAPKEGFRRLPEPVPRVPEARRSESASAPAIDGVAARAEPVEARAEAERAPTTEALADARHERPAFALTAPPARPPSRPTLEAVSRDQWSMRVERDGGRCTYLSAEGHRCESRWKLEYDHVEPAALGGPSTVAGLRLRCKAHNLLHAEETFGREHMAKFSRAGRGLRHGRVRVLSPARAHRK